VTYSATAHLDDVAPWQTYGAPEGEALVEIQGNPFAQPKEQLDEAVLAAMENSAANGIVLRFATRSPSARPGWRFIFLFGASPRLNSRDICVHSASLPLEPALRPLQVQAAYCAGDKLISESAGRIGAPGGLGDPALRHLIGRLTFDLTPPPVKADTDF
jgi:hypothetical protein